MEQQKQNKQPVDGQKLATFIVAILLILGGVACIVVGVVKLRTSGLTELFTSVFDVMGGDADAAGDMVDELASMLSSLLIAAGLVVGGLLLILIGLTVLRGYRKKEEDSKKSAASQAALLDSIQWQLPPVPLPSGAPAARESADETLDVHALEPIHNGGGWFCAECGKIVLEDFYCCPYCATRLLWHSPTVCPHCNSKVEADASFCSHCGQPIEKPAGVAKPTAPEKRCMYCGKILSLEQNECPECHHKYVKKK